MTSKLHSSEVKSSNIKDVKKKSYLEQLLNFVDFKESVCYVMCRISEVKKETCTDVEIGYSVRECESLLEEQDCLELKCADIYSNFSMLRQRVTDATDEKNFLIKQFKNYMKTLDEACCSLASTIIGRREVVSHSAKFHCFLFEFRKQVQGIKDFSENFDVRRSLYTEMELKINVIRTFTDQLCNLAGGVLSQGLQLIEVLMKIRLSESKKLSHKQHIGGWLAFVEAEKEFRLKELKCITFKIHSLCQLQRCEQGIRQALHWLKDLITAMLSQSEEIGESAKEADNLFLQHLQFKQVAEESLTVGNKLLTLRKNLAGTINLTDDDTQLQMALNKTWGEFLMVFKGIADRLNLCQNFYRNITKELRRLEDFKANIRSRLCTFGEIRRELVIKRFRKSWLAISTALGYCIETGKQLLETMERRLTQNHKVNLRSSSAAAHLQKTMADAEKAVEEVQSSYFNDEPTITESASEYISARSPDTWQSTSISGVDDWCSIDSEGGTTLDEFKSIDDDLAEEYISDDNIEDLPLNGQATTSKVQVPSSPIKEYAAITGINDPKEKKYTSYVQPAVVQNQPSQNVVPEKSAESGTSSASWKRFSQKPETSSPAEEMAIAVSPKSSVAFEPAKYSSVITKSEATEVKSETKKSYEIQTTMKAGGVKQTFTHQKIEGDRVHQSNVPGSVSEKIHKITLLDEAQHDFPKMSQTKEFSKDTAFSSQSKAELLSEIESLKSKYFKRDPEQDKTSIPKETKAETVSYGVSSFPGAKESTDVSRVVYSKETTESHSMTSISFQQQSFGANRAEKWQSVTPQFKLQSSQSTASEEIKNAEMLKNFEKKVKEVSA